MKNNGQLFLALRRKNAAIPSQWWRLLADCSKALQAKKKPPTQLHIANACLICPSNYCAWLDDTDIFGTEMLLIASLIQEVISQHSHSCLATAAAADILAACSYGTQFADGCQCLLKGQTAASWDLLPFHGWLCAPAHQEPVLPSVICWIITQNRSPYPSPGFHSRVLVSIPKPWSPSISLVPIP